MIAPGADLHAHTTASDGEFTPEELVRAARAAGIATLAVTDHDTMSGVAAAQAAGERMGIEVIAGVEMSCHWKTAAGGPQTVHVLGYFCDPRAEEMARLDRVKRESRTRRARAMVQRLRDLGVAVSFDRVRKIAGDAQIGRPHIARAVIEAGYEDDWGRVFDRWLGNDAPAYVSGERTLVPEAIELIRAAGGLAVIAHPYYDFHGGKLELDRLLPAAIEAGLAGLEVFYGSFPDAERAWALGYAERFDLVPTGGSDFHGPGSGTNPLGTSLCPPANLSALKGLRHPPA
ncbi:MAG: PHP domain-containing protein [Chloroflexi bacterium]|nr:PHP domain-containing protein [Chloroflexota bacterium]